MQSSTQDNREADIRAYGTLWYSFCSLLPRDDRSRSERRNAGISLLIVVGGDGAMAKWLNEIKKKNQKKNLVRHFYALDGCGSRQVSKLVAHALVRAHATALDLLLRVAGFLFPPSSVTPMARV